jgi:hypothetical protein
MVPNGEKFLSELELAFGIGRPAVRKRIAPNFRGVRYHAFPLREGIYGL